MCVVSAVSDYYMNDWRNRYPLDSTHPNPIPLSPQFDEETKRLLREALEKLDQIDKRLNDRDCKDEQKEKFLKSIGYEG